MSIHSSGRATTRLLLACCSTLVPALAGAQTADYEVLDNVEGAHVQLATAPIRPMALDQNNDLWAVNTNDNTVERFVLDGATMSTSPAEVIRVPWGPVSVATYVDPEGNEEVLVVCRSSWCLVRIDRATGVFLENIPLPAEPSDILVGGTLAFVSCTGADEVRQIDLTVYDGIHDPASTSTNDNSYSQESHPQFRIKSPLFLSEVPGLGVLVAPMHSGNNTTADGSSQAGNSSEEVISLDDLTTTQIEGLPDDDLFVILPASDAVLVAGQGTGTILFAHGLNPEDGAFWQLNTEAHNDRDQTEEELKGDFADNRLTRVASPSPVFRPAAGDHRLLDPGSGSFTVGSTIAQPFALEFLSDGQALVCGMGSDNVSLWDVGGNFLKEWDVPDGSIPRGLQAVTIDDGSGTQDYVLVYCWGRNTIQIHDYSLGDPATTGLAALELNHDSTPFYIAEGRRIFFDSSNSEFGNLSCATCHVDAGTDFLAWNLSSGPGEDLEVHSIDHKGPMVTQTLVGLARLAPFHWRGERDELEDFNGAFVGLLGADAVLEDPQFAVLKEYLFALANPANPNQNRERVIDPTIPFQNMTPNANAAVWQDQYNDDKEFQGRFACVDCHDFPTGTNNDLFVDGANVDIPERAHFKSTPFHEVWRKQQTSVPVMIDGVSDRRAFLGSGIGHSGGPINILDFTNNAVNAGSTADPNYLDNVVSLVHQFDQGLAPAVHFSFLLNADTQTQAASELTGYLLPQALDRNCDIAIVGRTLHNGNIVTVNWALDRNLSPAAFVCSDPTIPNRSLADFLTAAQVSGNQESNLFVGLPVGMAERFAVDFDMDGYPNGGDQFPLIPWQQAGSQPDPNPGMATVTVIEAPKWITTKAARFTIETDEPTLARVRYLDPDTGVLESVNSAYWSKTHSFAVTGLRPSTPNVAGLTTEFTAETVTYDFAFDVLDTNADVTVGGTLFPATTDPFIVPFDSNPVGPNFGNERDRIQLEEHVVAPHPTPGMSFPVVTAGALSGGSVPITVDLAAAYKLEGGDVPADRRFFALRVWKRTQAGGELELLDSGANVNFGAGTLGAFDVRVENLGPADPIDPLAFRQLDVSGPFVLLTDLTGDQGTPGATQGTFTLTNGWVSSGDEVVVSVEAVLEVPSDHLTEYQNRVLNFSCTGACFFDVPTNTLRAMSQWDMPSGTEDRIQGSVVVN